MGISRIGVVASNTGFGQGGKAQLEKLAPADGITIAISEVYDTAATDLTGVLTKIKAQNVQAVVNWSVEPAQSIVPKNMKQMGFDVPLFQSHGFGNINYVTAAGKAAEGIIFPCGRLLVADELPADHPQKQLLIAYKKEYEAKFKEEVSTFGGHAYDAFLDPRRGGEARRGASTRAKVRDAIERPEGVRGDGGDLQLLPDGPQRPHDGRLRDAHGEERRVRAPGQVAGSRGGMGACQLLQYLLSGVTTGSIYAIVGIGFTIIYNSTGIINFAQGEFLMLGGMIAISLQPRSCRFPLAIAVALLVTGLSACCCSSCSSPG